MRYLLILFILFSIPAHSQMLSKYVSYKEAFVSSTYPNITNIPDFCQEAVVKHIATHFFDSLRTIVGVPIYITSFFRDEQLNSKVGGAPNSDHLILEDVAAIDIDQDGKGKISNKALFQTIRVKFEFYKLIFEFNGAWIHVAVSVDPSKNKLKKVYQSYKVGNKTIYKVLSSSEGKQLNTFA